jgi:SsrA-binding protein
MKRLAFNKRANYDYDILSVYEAGIVLTGNEVRAIKSGHASLKGAFVTAKKNELYLTNAHITPYQNQPHHHRDPSISRKLLLHRHEISELIGKKSQQGLTLIPIEIYLKRRRVKVLVGLGRGKKKFDKREDIKRREAKKTIARISRDKL